MNYTSKDPELPEWDKVRPEDLIDSMMYSFQSIKDLHLGQFREFLIGLGMSQDDALEVDEDSVLLFPQFEGYKTIKWPAAMVGRVEFSSYVDKPLVYKKRSVSDFMWAPPKYNPNQEE